MPGSSSLDPLSFSPLDPRGPYGESVRVRVLVQGIVKGVGRRPFVYRLANRLALGGCVRNDTGRVTIELRARKVREDKLFALMAADVGVVQQICEVSDHEPELLSGYRRPGVVNRRG